MADDKDPTTRKAKALEKLCPQSYDIRHKEIKARRAEGTGDWLLKNETFRDWKEGQPGSPLLWAQGVLGTGKTFLCSTVIEHLSKTTGGAGVAYYYFYHRAKEEQRAEDILGYLVKQLADQVAEIPEETLKALEELPENSSYDRLLDVLLSLSRSFERTFLVFDALEECDRENRGKLLQMFQKLAQEGVKLFVASRPHPADISTVFTALDARVVEIVANPEDIKAYAKARLEKDSTAKDVILKAEKEKWAYLYKAEEGKEKLDLEIPEKMISDLLEDTRGIFLFAQLSFEHLCKQTTPKQVLEEHEKLKAGSKNAVYVLDPSYDAAMDQIMQQPEETKKRALDVLLWLVHTRSPLKLDGVRMAVSIIPGKYKLDEADLPDSKTLLEACAGLVCITKEYRDENLQLVNPTLRDYLLRKAIVPVDVDTTLAIACLTYLSFDTFKKRGSLTLSNYNSQHYYYSIDSSRSHEDPFYHYATVHVQDYLLHAEESATAPALRTFLGSSASRHAYSGHYPKLPLETPLYYSAESILPLHLSAWLGHLVVSRELLDEGADVSARAANGWTPLYHALWNDHRAVAKLLLDRGAEVSSKDYHGDTVLHVAACMGKFVMHGAQWHGTEEALPLLLQYTTDLNPKNKDGNTPLHFAISARIVQLLVDGGADVNAVNNLGQTPLHAALRSYEDHHEGSRVPVSEEVVHKLVDCGADIMATDSEGRTPLHLAGSAYETKGFVAKFLIERGADISAADSAGQRPIHTAVMKGKEEVVRLLLEMGADAVSPDSKGITPLHTAAASKKCEPELVELLIAHGADVTAADEEGSTPLHNTATTSYGHHGYRYKGSSREIAELLLEKGAEIRATNNAGRTLLHVAACENNKSVLKVILAHTQGDAAFINARDKEGTTALHSAVDQARDYSDAKACERLLAAGADISATDGKGQGVVSIAIRAGGKECAKDLVKRGASVSVPDNEGWLPVHRACCWNLYDLKDLIKVLFENGAEQTPLPEKTVYAKEDVSGYQPIHLCVMFGGPRVLKGLLKVGADANARNPNGDTPLLLLCRYSQLRGSSSFSDFSKIFRKMVPILLEHGADTSIVDRDGKTPHQLLVDLMEEAKRNAEVAASEETDNPPQDDKEKKILINKDDCEDTEWAEKMVEKFNAKGTPKSLVESPMQMLAAFEEILGMLPKGTVDGMPKVDGQAGTVLFIRRQD